VGPRWPRARRRLTRGVPRPTVRWTIAAFWVVGPSALGRVHTERVSVFVGLLIYVLLVFEKGIFPGY
jgi:hypothetical protein